MNWLVEPLGYEFARNALAAGVLVGVLCPMVGAYLVVQRMTLLGNVISHAVLPGLAIARALGVDLLWGAFASGLCSALAITWVQERARVRPDAAMALTLASFFALGVALVGVLDSRLDLEGFLFGDLLSVSGRDVWETGAIAATVAIAIALNYKELLFYTFDPVGAEVAGLPVRGLRLGSIAAVTLAVVASMKTVGVILVTAMLVGPAIAAQTLVGELHWIVLLGIGFGVLAAVSGLYASYYLDLPSGATIALAIAVLFGLALAADALRERWLRRQAR